MTDKVVAEFRGSKNGGLENVIVCAIARYFPAVHLQSFRGRDEGRETEGSKRRCASAPAQIRMEREREKFIHHKAINRNELMWQGAREEIPI